MSLTTETVHLLPGAAPKRPRVDKFCVYSHSVNGEIFYVGAGRPKRPYCFTRRPQSWYTHVRRHGWKFEINIIEWFDDRNSAAWLEAELLERHNPLCNKAKVDRRVYAKGGPIVSTAVALPVALRDRLDRVAKSQGVSRSFVVRNVMAGWLQDFEREAAE